MRGQTEEKRQAGNPSLASCQKLIWDWLHGHSANTFMVELEKVLHAKGVSFSSTENHIWQHVLSLLKTAPEGDVMAVSHSLVGLVQSSGDHHVAFLDIICESNATQKFIPIKTRWDSAYGMLKRLIPTQPAIDVMSAKCKYHDLQENLNDEQWKMAEKIRDILEFPHMVQHLMSGKKTLILSGAVPAFQSLQDHWEEHAHKYPEVQRYIVGGMDQLNKYHNKAGKTCAYVMAMVLNPSIKLYFINKNFSPMEQETVIEWIKDKLKMYRAIITAMPSTTSNKKLSTSAHIKLSLIDSNDNFGEETSIDNEYNNYMVLLHHAYAKISVLTFWQLCPEI
ncbi:hypothetical protein BS47DRAFT_1413530 [Hydnum rufescens UP504]|uniref:Uncharacterized protein n=1 Tax=Hydnum rufescens UP504 TaxID=1448309 RepID=A0A9P6APH2_9AGAM|nr:hypothetical protein BS47DRAFT_1413530 [Hydnum rufescens UP504]